MKKKKNKIKTWKEIRSMAINLLKKTNSKKEFFLALDTIAEYYCIFYFGGLKNEKEKK